MKHIYHMPSSMEHCVQKEGIMTNYASMNFAVAAITNSVKAFSKLYPTCCYQWKNLPLYSFCQDVQYLVLPVYIT